MPIYAEAYRYFGIFANIQIIFMQIWCQVQHMVVTKIDQVKGWHKKYRKSVDVVSSFIIIISHLLRNTYIFINQYINLAKGQ